MRILQNLENSGSVWDVSISSVTTVFLPGTYSVGGPSGMTLTISKGVSSSVTGTISASVTAQAGVIFASASTTLGVSLALSQTVTDSVGGSMVVPSNVASGYLTLGSVGRSFTATATQYNNNCVVIAGPYTGPVTGASTVYYVQPSWLPFTP